jgi:hypothetical protein
MKDSDLLNRAARALRDSSDGQRPGSGYTRARIMRQLHQQRRRRVLGWLGFSPLLALVAGSAWAQGTDSWHRVWEGVHYTLSSVSHVISSSDDTVKPAPKTTSPVNAAAATSAVPQLPEPSMLEPSVLEPSMPALPPRVQTLDGGAAQSRGGTAPLASSKKRAPSPRRALPELPSEPGKDPELVEFRAAHDAHFRGTRGGSSRAALSAYQSYLEHFPNGRFVPEARYNLGLLQLKNGDSKAARATLAPFAQGAFGGYRQTQAQALLDAIDHPDHAAGGGPSQ